MQSTTRACPLHVLGCLVFHLVGTWFIPLIDRDEPRFAEASREMLERHDFVVPYFNNQYRFDKPPLTYWAQTLSFEIFGENDFAARFPSAVAAALVAVALYAWGRRLGDKSPSNVQHLSRSGLEEREGECWRGGHTPGWSAAIIFTLSFQVVEHSKAAVADMWLVLFVTLAHWAAWELIANRQSPIENLKRWWWLFYIALALGFLAKGPIAWTPLLTVPIFARLASAPAVAQRFRFVRGMILTLGLVCLWGIPALLQTHGEFLRVGLGRHVIGRSIGVIGGHGGSSAGLYFLLLPFYFVTVFLTFFPWSLKLPALLARLRQRRDETDVYLLTGATIIFLIFTFVRTRLLHYTLPAFPLLALLLARMLAQENSRRFVRNCACVMAPLYVIALLCFAPLAGIISPVRELARAAKGSLTSDMQLAAVEFQEPSLVWYFRGHTRSFMHSVASAKAKDFMAEAGARCMVLPTEMAQQTWPITPPDWKRYSTQGYNVAKGKHIELTLLVKEK